MNWRKLNVGCTHCAPTRQSARSDLRNVKLNCTSCLTPFYLHHLPGTAKQQETALHEYTAVVEAKMGLLARLGISWDSKFDKLFEEELTTAKSIVAVNDYETRKTIAKENGIETILHLCSMINLFCNQNSSPRPEPEPAAIKTMKTMTEKLLEVAEAMELASYDLIHPQLSQFSQEWLDEDLVTLLEQVKKEGAQHKQLKHKHFKHEGGPVWSTPILSHKVCSLLVDELRNIKSTLPLASLNCMGVVVEHLGMDGWLTHLATLLNDASKCFGQHTDLKFKTASFIYYGGNDEGIKEHTDNSDLTVNICLGDIFQGGDLVFEERGGKTLTVPHRKGRGTIHPGTLAHRSNTTLSGERFNLILWMDAPASFEPFLSLPTDVQLHVLSFGSAGDLARFSVCSRHCHELASTDSLWKPLYDELPLKAEMRDQIVNELRTKGVVEVPLGWQLWEKHEIYGDVGPVVSEVEEKRKLKIKGYDYHGEMKPPYNVEVIGSGSLKEAKSSAKATWKQRYQREHNLPLQFAYDKMLPIKIGGSERKTMSFKPPAPRDRRGSSRCFVQ